MEQPTGRADDPAVALAAYAADLTFERLPDALVAVLKRIVLDTLGTALAGSTLGTGCGEVLAVVRDAGGRPESTLLGCAARVPAPQAALANGATCHALNYEDVYPGGGHLGAVTFPAALAVAERQGAVSGREFLVALAAGTELAARLQVAVRRADDGTSEAKPQPTQFLGCFAAAASAGRVLRLDAAGMGSALGLALMQASGNRQPVVEGTPAKAIYAAFPNQNGVLSALLAARGLRADCAVFEGEAGLLPTAYANRYYRPALVEGLGEQFYTLDVGFKPWPTTNRAHPFIEAALELAARHPLGDIEEVHIRGGNHIRTFCEPLAVRQQPRTSVEAEDSIFFGVAKALVNRAVTLADFQPAGLRQPETMQLGARMRYSIEPELGHAGIVEVTTRGGARYTCRVDKPLGDPAKPLSDAQLVAKFRDCAQHAANGLAPATVDAVIAFVEQLEQAPDVGALTALLRAG